MARRKLSRAAGRPPDGEPWVWHTLALISSPAWCGMSINCHRLITFLEMEHLGHGGSANGSLLATYTQLTAHGITRRLIAATVSEAEQRGLVCVERGGKKGDCMTEVNRYRLTYCWTKTRAQSGLWEWHAPTDNWKRYEGGRNRPHFGNRPSPTSGTTATPISGTTPPASY